MNIDSVSAKQSSGVGSYNLLPAGFTASGELRRIRSFWTTTVLALVVVLFAVSFLKVADVRRLVEENERLAARAAPLMLCEKNALASAKRNDEQAVWLQNINFVKPDDRVFQSIARVAAVSETTQHCIRLRSIEVQQERFAINPSTDSSNTNQPSDWRSGGGGTVAAVAVVPTKAVANQWRERLNEVSFIQFPIADLSFSLDDSGDQDVFAAELAGTISEFGS